MDNINIDFISNNIDTIIAWIIGISLILYLLLSIVKFTIETLNKLEYSNAYFFIWPAIFLETFFSFFWGKYEFSKKGIFNLRNIVATLFFSILINLLCINLLYNNIPIDLDFSKYNFFSILLLNEIVFLLFNFISDFISINITRYFLNKIINCNKHRLKYIFFDLLGIIFGYFVMFIPSIILLFIFGENDNFNSLIQYGIFGNYIISYFLLIFIFSESSFILSFFSFFSLASITLPSMIYIISIIFINSLIKVSFIIKKINLSYIIKTKNLLIKIMQNAGILTVFKLFVSSVS